MKKILLVALVSVYFCHVNYSQTSEITGKPLVEIFTDFHTIVNDTTKTTGFSLNRAQFGYNFLPGGNFSSTIIINIGNPQDLALVINPRRYAYFREASVTYSKDKLNISFGIANTRIFNYQQKFWGKRYIAPEYQATNGYGTVADLGIVMDYIFNDIVKIDMAVLNGEGYSNIQLDNSLKITSGITITPDKQLAFRLYGDMMRINGVWQNTMIAFAGFKNDLITFGVEASYKSNLEPLQGHDGWGVSTTGAVKIIEKSELFVRFDYSASTQVPGDTLQWNYKRDGSFLIAGIQRTLSNNVKLALNYQGTFPYNPESQISNAVFLNALFKF
jgi:hypothetical protein